MKLDLSKLSHDIEKFAQLERSYAQEIDKLKKELKDTVDENDLLIQQLHLTQETFEELIISVQDSKKKVELQKIQINRCFPLYEALSLSNTPVFYDIITIPNKVHYFTYQVIYKQNDNDKAAVFLLSSSSPMNTDNAKSMGLSYSEYFKCYFKYLPPQSGNYTIEFKAFNSDCKVGFARFKTNKDIQLVLSSKALIDSDYDDISKIEKQKHREILEQCKTDYELQSKLQSQEFNDKLDEANERVKDLNLLLETEKSVKLAVSGEFEEYKYQNYLISRSGLASKLKFSGQRLLKTLSSNKVLALVAPNKVDSSKLKQVLLTEQAIWLELDVSCNEKLNFYIATKYENVIQNHNKALLLIQYLSEDGSILKDSYGNIPYSSEKDAHFYYLKDSHGKSVKVLSITVPANAAKLRLGFCSFYNFINEYVYINPLIVCEKFLQLKEITSITELNVDKIQKLTDNTLWSEIKVSPKERIRLYSMVEYQNIVPDKNKKVLLLISYLDSSHNRIENIYGKMPYSAQKKANFYYIADSAGKVVELATFEVPANVCYLQIGVSGFGIQQHETVNVGQQLFYERLMPTKLNLIAKSVPSKTVVKHPQPLRQIKVAIILDEFSYNSFKDTFTPVIIEPSNWREVFEKERPEIFFCESAWSGVDSKVRPWKGQIYASVNFKKENRTQLLAIIEYCKQNCIPTVFWNKEDPTHFTDRVHDFVKTAQLFDYVFTTAQECVESYKTEYGIKNAYCLQFATNPRLFNPIEKYQRSDDVIFAGSWYENHVERSEDMVKIFDAVLDSDIGLVIHDRYYGDTDPLHKYPGKYLPYVKPNVPFKEIDKVYKGSIFGLNINTVKQSTTMFARRVFELMSSNTCIISNYSKGIKNMFGDSVIFLDENTDLLKNINKKQIVQIREGNLHNVLANHTYRNRFKSILDKIGFKYLNDDVNLTICCILNNPEDAELAIKYYQNQLISNAKLLLIISESVDDIDVAPLYTKFNGDNVEIISLSYIRKYGKLDYKVSTSHCAFIDCHKDVDANYLENAILHTSYLDDEFILLSSGTQYHLSESEILADVIVKSQYFEYVLQNYNKNVTNKFYSLNLGQD